jgi:hypothetical protein
MLINIHIKFQLGNLAVLHDHEPTTLFYPPPGGEYGWDT